MTPNPLFDRVALDLVQRLLRRLRRFRCSRRSVETKCESGLLASFKIFAVGIGLRRYVRSALHHHEANCEAPLWATDCLGHDYLSVMLQRASTRNATQTYCAYHCYFRSACRLWYASPEV